MKQQKTALLFLVLTASLIANGQELHSNLFIRTPQVVNFNFQESRISYSPVISAGVGLSHKSKFIELATFIDASDNYGFYTFFGTTLKSKELSQNLHLNINYFGEVAFVPGHGGSASALGYTSGICLFPFYRFNWGSVGVPFCLGLGYSQRTLNLNSRTILNLSLNLH